MFCLFFRIGYILIFAIRLSGVHTSPDSQVGYETLGMLILSALSNVAGSGVALGMWAYPTQRAVYFRTPLALGPRCPSLSPPTFSPINIKVLMCVLLLQLLIFYRKPPCLLVRVRKQELHIKPTFVHQRKLTPYD